MKFNREAVNKQLSEGLIGADVGRQLIVLNSIPLNKMNVVFSLHFPVTSAIEGLSGKELRELGEKVKETIKKYLDSLDNGD